MALQQCTLNAPHVFEVFIVFSVASYNLTTIMAASTTSKWVMIITVSNDHLCPWKPQMDSFLRNILYPVHKVGWVGLPHYCNGTWHMVWPGNCTLTLMPLKRLMACHSVATSIQYPSWYHYTRMKIIDLFFHRKIAKKRFCCKLN